MLNNLKKNPIQIQNWNILKKMLKFWNSNYKMLKVQNSQILNIIKY